MSKVNESYKDYYKTGPVIFSLKAIAGQALWAFLFGGREGIQIHGGKESAEPRFNTTIAEKGNLLRPTLGCLRLSDTDVKDLAKKVEEITTMRDVNQKADNNFLGFFIFPQKDYLLVIDE